MSNTPQWQTVTKAAPCPACGKPDWCAWTADGWLKCERSAETPPGMERVSVKDGGALFRPVDHRVTGRARSVGDSARRPRPAARDSTLARPPIDWPAEAERLRAALPAERAAGLAAALGVHADSLSALGVGWASEADLRRYKASGEGWPERYPAGAFAFPERDGAGRIVGVSLRTEDGRQGAPSSRAGAHRGIIVPATLAERRDPVLIVEGASDVAACGTLGLAAVGRPSNTGGAEHLARLLKGRGVLVVGERDEKPNGAWPGRDGAERTATRLASAWGKPVGWTLPPEGTKDVRVWLTARRDAGLDVADGEACRAAGAELLAALTKAAGEAPPEKNPPQAELLVRLALERYRLGVAEGDEPFAEERDGPNVALMLRGSRDALRSALARDYRRRYGTTPSASALADALTALAGEAMECGSEPVHLRVAEHEGRIVVDLGGPDGAAIVVTPDGWEVVETSPVLFRRTALTGPLPEPTRGGSSDALRGLLNVTDGTWPLLLGWIVAAFIPGIPHPILMLGGEQGAGKSTAARYAVGLFDPSAAPLRSPPRDEEGWVMAANGSWGVGVDNVSTIHPWWSDALCKAVTGDGWARRRLYTDSELSVLSFRRVVALTSIDAGALRGDLGDRLLLVDLERIIPSARRGERALNRAYSEQRPAMLGALLDVVAAVLRELPLVDLPESPRMADFAAVLAAMDRAIGTNALPLYLGQAGRVAADVVEADPVGLAVAAFMEGKDEWSGTMGELLGLLPAPEGRAGWPKNARGLVGPLKRLIPPLRQMGVDITPPAPTDKARRYVLRRTAQTAQPPETPSRMVVDAGTGWAVAPNRPPDRPGDRPTLNGTPGGVEADSGRSGDSGGRIRPSSACRCCGRDRWWRAADGAGDWTCGACHPPAVVGVVWHGALDTVENP